jgi:hypothetical protein
VTEAMEEGTRYGGRLWPDQAEPSKPGEREVPPVAPSRSRVPMAIAVVATLSLIAAGIVFLVRPSGDMEVRTLNERPAASMPDEASAEAPVEEPQVVIKPPGQLHGKGTTKSLSSSSVTLTWSRPSSGDPPDRYVILRGGEEIGRTTRLTFTDEGVTWGSSYVYRVQSIARGELSKASKVERATTPNPPLLEARLEGSAATSMNTVLAQPFLSPASQWDHTATWTFMPSCGSGPCSVKWTASHGRFSATGGTLDRSASTYSGTDESPLRPNRCGGSPVPTFVRLAIRVTDAAKIGQEWRATGFSGTMTEYSNWPARCGGITQKTLQWTFSGSLP